ncbi:MAG: hypothetical protein IJU71_11535, partial [Selenomonadaceae bacterium]|nr:hypothetical protein [Selenomonadaceae bacterium]
MKKIIVCGLRDAELMRSIEYFLSDDCEIVGYYHCYPRAVKPLLEREYYSIEQLKSVSFDHLVLATLNASHLAALIKNLSALGCNEKIVIPTSLKPNS